MVLSLEYSPNGRSLAFIAKKDRKKILVIDGKESELYDDIDILSFKYSPD